MWSRAVVDTAAATLACVRMAAVAGASATGYGSSSCSAL
jgi:hypothetical protein